MSWLEISFEITSGSSEMAGQILEDLGALSISQFDAGNQPILEPLPGTTPLWDNIKIVGLFTADSPVDIIQNKLKALFPTGIFKATPLADQEWTRTWLDHFQPMCFGKKLWIVPNDQPAPEQADAVIVRLDPGLAFGTGTHQTTALCLEWLDANAPIDQLVMDYGCGSGILGIAALKLGARYVTAVDYDPQALTATIENAKNNQCSDALAALLPEQVKTEKASLILANILAGPLVELAPIFAQRCEAGGQVVLSGMLANQIESVKAAYEPWFTCHEEKTKDEWALLSLFRNPV